MAPNKIVWTPVSEEAQHVVPRPVPAGDAVPEWFKRIPAFANGGKPKYGPYGDVDKTAKLCLPFSDTFRMGYIQKTWMEMEILPSDDGTDKVGLVASGHPKMIEARPKSDLIHKISPDFHPIEFVWKSQWMPRLPKGYSAILTHPFNREELPFVTMTGVVDYDAYHHDTDGNHPFLLKRGFTGRIPIGTPMFQIIPFKREDWVSEEAEYSPLQVFEAQKMLNRFWGAYKDMFWSKKSFK